MRKNDNYDYLVIKQSYNFNFLSLIHKEKYTIFVV